MPNPAKHAYKIRRDILTALEACLDSTSGATVVKAASQIVKIAAIDSPYEKPVRVPGQRYAYNMRGHAIRILKKKVLGRLEEVMGGEAKTAAVDAAALLLKIAGPSRDVEFIAPLDRETFEGPA